VSNRTPWELRDVAKSNEIAGVWVEAQTVPGWWFRVRRSCEWNADFAAAVVRIAEDPIVKAYLERARSPDYVLTTDDKAIDKLIQIKSFVEGHVTEWKGVTGRDNELVAFSHGRCTTVFEHFPDIERQMRIHAATASNYRALTVQEQGDLALGNLPRASNSLAVNGATH
jgi:hypothetical protein